LAPEVAVSAIAAAVRSATAKTADNTTRMAAATRNVFLVTHIKSTLSFYDPLHRRHIFFDFNKAPVYYTFFLFFCFCFLLEFYNPGSGVNIHYRIVNLLSFSLVILLNGS